MVELRKRKPEILKPGGYSFLNKLKEFFDVNILDEVIDHPLRSLGVLGLAVFLRIATFKSDRWKTKN